MADVGDTTGARVCAPDSEVPDPVILLLELRQRQLEAWRAMPAHADELRNPVADMSWGATDALLARLGPATAAGAVMALRHLFQCLRRDHLSADTEYPLPLAERALSTLERLVAA